MSIKDVIEVLEGWLNKYVNDGNHANFYGDDEALDTAQGNFEHVQKALEELNQIK